MCVCVCVGGGGYCRLWPCAHPVLYLHLNEAGKVIYWQGVWAAVSRSLSLFNQRVKATLISQPGKVTYRAPLPKSFFSRLHLSPFPFFFHRGVGGGPWPRRVMSCPVAESTAVRWIWKQKQVLELLCATRINKTPSQSLVSQHHHTTLLQLRCYWRTVIFTLKGKHTQKWNLSLSFDLLMGFFSIKLLKELKHNIQAADFHTTGVDGDFIFKCVLRHI